MFVSIRIPKTAGTSLGTMFDHSSNRRVFWDYDPQYRFAREILPEVRADIGFIRGWYRFVHGHFHYAEYAELLGDAVFVSCIRHPVARAVSHVRRCRRRATGASR